MPILNRDILLIQDLSGAFFQCNGDKIEYITPDVVDNGDGTFTWSAPGKAPVTWSSETVVMAGINITVDGSGTPIDPYVVNGYGLADNGDNTYTVTRPDGTTFDIDATISSVVPVDHSATTPFGQTPIGDHDDGDGNVQTLNTPITGFQTNGDGTQDYISEDGTRYCVPECINPTVTTVDDIYTANSDAPFYANVSVNDTPCDEGNTVYKLIEGTQNNAEYVVLGANGEFVAQFEDNTMPLTFLYLAECDNGIFSASSVTINPPPIIGANAVDDSFAGPSGGIPITGSVIGGDAPCSEAGVVTTYELNTSSTDGITIVDAAGNFIFIPFAPSFTGTTTFTYNILCDGVVADTATVTIVVIAASAADDFEIGLFETPTGSYDATVNDSPCTPPAATTYNWNAGLATGFGGSVAGTPDNFTYTPPASFCGTDWIRYDILCDGVVFDTATVFIFVSCANPIGDVDLGTTNTPESIDVSSNDFPCTGGAQTTYHLVTDPTANGGGLSEPLSTCNGAGCPQPGVGNEISSVLITSWDIASGQGIITPSDGWSGEACYEYFIRCTNPVTGDFTDFGPVCNKFVIDPVLPLTRIATTHIAPSSDLFQVCLGGNFDNSTPLQVGDLYRLEVPEIGIDVELIVGQNILVPAGYQNDVGTYAWSSFVNHITTPGTLVMTGANLQIDNICFTFNKYDAAVDAGLYGDGVGGNPTGSDWTFNGTVTGNSIVANTATDTVVKLYDGISVSMTTAYSTGFVDNELHGIRGYYHNNTEILFAGSETWSASQSMDVSDDGFGANTINKPLIQQSTAGVFGVGVHTPGVQNDFAEGRITDIVYPITYVPTNITPPPGATLRIGGYTQVNGQNAVRISRVYKDLSNKTLLTFTLEGRYRNNFTPVGVGASRLVNYYISPTSGAPAPVAPTYTHTFAGGTGSLTHVFPTPHTFPSEGHYLLNTENIHGGAAQNPYENYWVTVYSY